MSIFKRGEQGMRSRLGTDSREPIVGIELKNH